MIILFSKPNCPDCDKTKSFFKKNNIEYRLFDVSEDKGAFLAMNRMGFESAPVVITDNNIWSGYQLKLLKTLTSS
jgi:glutaredoxin-like protein NrdH